MTVYLADKLFRFTVNKTQLPDPPGCLELDHECHLGLTSLAVSKIDGDFCDLISETMRQKGQFDLEELSLGMDTMKGNFFEFIGTPETVSRGSIPVGEPQDEAGKGLKAVDTTTPYISGANNYIKPSQLFCHGDPGRRTVGEIGLHLADRIHVPIQKKLKDLNICRGEAHFSRPVEYLQATGMLKQ